MPKTKAEIVESLGKEERDGSEFDLIAQLRSSAKRGSKLAKAQLQMIDNFDHEKAKSFDAEIKELFPLWENQFRELLSDRGEMKQYYLNLMEEFPVMKTFADEHLDFARNLGDY